MAAIFLLALNATTGTSRYSLDAWIERRIPWWATVAELGIRPVATDGPPLAVGGDPV